MKVAILICSVYQRNPPGDLRFLLDLIECIVSFVLKKNISNLGKLICGFLRLAFIRFVNAIVGL